MAADGHKMLAAVLVTIFEDIGHGTPLAPDAKSFDARVPDSLTGRQFRDRFGGNSKGGQLATTHFSYQRAVIV
jgi:hypothetical protein